MSFVKDLIENPHQIYLDNIHYWDFLLQSYEGGKDYTNVDLSQLKNSSIIDVKVNGQKLRTSNNNNLFQHKRERTQDYTARLERSYYYNFCSPIIDIYTNHLFRDSVESDFGSIEKSVEAREDNIDLMDSNLTEFRKSVAEAAQIYGHCFISVDSPRFDNVISMQDKIDRGLFPYFCLINPQQVINWSLDKFGKPNWVLVAEPIDTNTTPDNFDKEGGADVVYRLWERDKWSLYDSMYNLIDTNTHNLGQVPLIPAFNKQSKKAKSFLGISKIADIAFIARDVYNLCSELDQILTDQTFAFLAVQGKASDYSETELGTNKGIVYPEGHNVPSYVSPPPANAETLMKRIDAQITAMFRLAKLEGGSASFSGQSATSQSGVSKAWDFNETNSELVRMASNMEDAEIRMWDLFAKWEGKEWDGTITYSKDFNVKSLNEDLEQAEKTMKLNMGKHYNDMVKKAIVNKKFPRLSEKDKTKIDEEIETTQPTQTRLSERVGNLFNRNADNSGNNGGLNDRAN